MDKNAIESILDQFCKYKSSLDKDQITTSDMISQPG